MNSKRKTMLVAALVVAVVAAAGIGYATVTGYKASTEVSANDVGDSQYLTIKPNDDVYSAKFTGLYAFNTVNSEGTVKFSEVNKVGTGDALVAANFSYANIAAETFSPVTTNTDGATYKYVSVSEAGIVVDVDVSHSENTLVKLTASIKDNSNVEEYVEGSTTNVQLIFTYKVGEGAEKIFVPGTTQIKYDVMGGTNNAKQLITFNAYLIVLQAGSAVGSVNAGSNGALINATITFEAETIASLT